MDFDLQGKVALVTGGSRGLGREMVLAFARAGADVVISSRKLDACEELAEVVREETGRTALAVAAHAGRWDDVGALVDTVYGELGRVDVLVNNAGMAPLYPKLSECGEDLFDKVIAVNLKGPFRLGALIGERMQAGDGGSIINISSIGRGPPDDDRPALRRGQGRAEHADGRLRRVVRPDGALQRDHGRPVPHRHLQGVGRRRVRGPRRARSSRCNASASRPRSSAPPSTSRPTPRASPPARSSRWTAASPSPPRS